MRMVTVRHKPRQKQVYCFSVPSALAPYLGNANGTRGTCITRKGIQPGTIVGDSMEGSEAMRFAKENGAHFPLASITSVRKMLPIDQIRVPGYLLNSRPRAEKLQQRRAEYESTGEFSTAIRIDAMSGELLDGYTAYVAAKQMGLNKLHCWVSM